MPLRQVLLVFLVCVAAGRAAELKTLKGEVVTGVLDSLTDKEIVLRRGSYRVVTPLHQVVQVDFGPAGKPRAEGKFSDVELTDGSILHCVELIFKGKDAELTLVGGQTVRLPLLVVSSILNEAQDEKNRKDWSERLAKKRRRDVLTLLREGVVNAIEGTLGEADRDGKTIEFTLAAGRKANVPLANVHGLIFQRGSDPNAPLVICKLLDSQQNVLYVSSLSGTPAGLIATTPAGARITFTPAQLSRLDFSRDKLAFLSDLEPNRITETSTEERVEHYRRDKNLDDGPIRVGGQTYARGLSLHATTELEYDLKGEYREFKAVAGIDDLVGGLDGPTILRIEGDGKELFSWTLSRKDKERFRPVALNIKDVQKLTISVTSGDLLDLGKHLTLADAKVSK